MRTVREMHTIDFRPTFESLPVVMLDILNLLLKKKSFRFLPDVNSFISYSNTLSGFIFYIFKVTSLHID